MFLDDPAEVRGVVQSAGVGNLLKREIGRLQKRYGVLYSELFDILSGRHPHTLGEFAVYRGAVHSELVGELVDVETA